MRYVSATDAKQRLAEVLDAAQREPVIIRRQKRDVAVVLSPREYKDCELSTRRSFSASATASPNRPPLGG